MGRTKSERRDIRLLLKVAIWAAVVLADLGVAWACCFFGDPPAPDDSDLLIPPPPPVADEENMLLPLRELAGQNIWGLEVGYTLDKFTTYASLEFDGDDELVVPEDMVWLSERHGDPSVARCRDLVRRHERAYVLLEEAARRPHLRYRPEPPESDDLSRALFLIKNLTLVRLVVLLADQAGAEALRALRMCLDIGDRCLESAPAREHRLFALDCKSLAQRLVPVVLDRVPPGPDGSSLDASLLDSLRRRCAPYESATAWFADEVRYEYQEFVLVYLKEFQAESDDLGLDHRFEPNRTRARLAALAREVLAALERPAAEVGPVVEVIESRREARWTWIDYVTGNPRGEAYADAFVDALCGLHEYRERIDRREEAHHALVEALDRIGPGDPGG